MTFQSLKDKIKKLKYIKIICKICPKRLTTATSRITGICGMCAKKIRIEKQKQLLEERIKIYNIDPMKLSKFIRSRIKRHLEFQRIFNKKEFYKIKV